MSLSPTVLLSAALCAALYKFYFGRSGPYRRQSSFLLILIVASSSEPLLFRPAPDMSSDLRSAALVFIITACADRTGLRSGVCVCVCV